LLYFVYAVQLPYSLTLIFFIHLPPSHNYPSMHCTFIYSCFSLLIYKSMYKGASQGIPTVSILYLGLFNPFLYSPLPLLAPIFNNFQYISLYTLPLQTLCFIMSLMFYDSLFLSLITEFYRAVSLLQIWSTYEFVYDHACFCVYVCFRSIFHMWEKTSGLSLSKSGLLHWTWLHPFTFKLHDVIISYGWVKLHIYLYIPIYI
jgi:hypothetical protein